jgi:hypothetical protein
MASGHEKQTGRRRHGEPPGYALFLSEFGRALRNKRPRPILGVASLRLNDEMGESTRLTINFSDGSIINEIIQTKFEAEGSFYALARYIGDFNVSSEPDFFNITFGNSVFTSVDMQREKRKLRIPDKAPELYAADWSRTEQLPDFVRRVWGPYKDAGLTMTHIWRMDKKLYRAIVNYRAQNLPWPDELTFPSQTQKLAAAVELFKAGKVDQLTPLQIMSVARKLQRDAERPPQKRGRKRKAEISP